MKRKTDDFGGQSKSTVKKLIASVCIVCAVFLSGCAYKAASDLTTLRADEISSGANVTDDDSSDNPLSEATVNQGNDINATTKAPETTVSDQANNNASEMIVLGEAGADTLTGYASLPLIDFTAADPDNSRGLSEKKISHSHGPASDGKVHYTVLEFQKTFDKYNALAVDTISTDKVLYLTFDCGWEHDNLTNQVLDVLEEKDVPAAFFCTLTHIKQQPELIARMIKSGHIVGNHSATHPSFAEIDREQMADELEKTENYLRENFGYAAKYFRFPSGEYTENALELVSSLGYMCAFWSVAYDDWDVNNERGADYAVETVMKRLHPGAVILLHSVSRDNAEALGTIIDKAREQGYTFLSLQDYNN